MFIENKNVHYIISVILIGALIFTSVFASSMAGSVFADTDQVADVAAAEEKLIEDLTMDADPDAEFDGYIVKVEDGKERKVDDSAVDDYESTSDNEYVAVDDPSDVLDFVDPQYVEYIEPNYLRYAMDNETANDRSLFASSYTGRNMSSYNLVNISSAWDAGYTGTGSEITIFDSGLNVNHQYLVKNNISSTIGFVGSDANGVINTRYQDGLGHGTFVTGLIASSSSAIKGISYGSKINAYKVISDRGTGSVKDFIFSLNYLNSRTSSSNVPDVINMSFGGSGYSKSEYNHIKTLTDKGAIVVAAVGNEGEKGSPYNYPANYPQVIGVGSVNARGVVSYFSTVNSSVTVVAPGENLVSLSSSSVTGLTNQYAAISSGTSYSAPIVAAAAALFDQDGASGITLSKFLTLLKTTSTEAYATGYDMYTGYGIINIGKMAEVIDSAGGVSAIKNSYQLAYELDGGALSGTINTIHTQGTATALPGKSQMKKKGYTFSHWKDQNGVKRTSIPASYNGGSLTLTAVWNPNKYKLKFKGNGGKISVKSKTVKYYKGIGTLKAPKKRDGYNFLGWYTKKKGGSQYYKGRVYKKTGNLTLYARWTKSKVVKFKGNGGVVKKYAQKIKEGNRYGTLPKPTRTGYKFKGWYTKKKGGTKVTKNTRVKTSGNVTLYAKWKKK